MKRLSLICLLMFLMVRPTWTEPQISTTVTFVTGTAVRVAPVRTMANSLFIEVLPNASGSVVYVLYADLAATCSTSTTSQIVAVLAAGTSSAPGGNFTYPSNNTATSSAGGFDASRWCTQGTTGNTAVVSYDLRN